MDVPTREGATQTLAALLARQCRLPCQLLATANTRAAMNEVLVTTSWDDGDPGDLRLAEELAEFGLHGTFYLCREFNGRPRLSDAQIRELAAIPGVEVGSHTLTHPDLR